MVFTGKFQKNAKINLHKINKKYLRKFVRNSEKEEINGLTLREMYSILEKK